MRTWGRREQEKDPRLGFTSLLHQLKPQPNHSTGRVSAPMGEPGSELPLWRAEEAELYCEEHWAIVLRIPCFVLGDGICFYGSS